MQSRAHIAMMIKVPDVSSSRVPSRVVAGAERNRCSASSPNLKRVERRLKSAVRTRRRQVNPRSQNHATGA
jgi:hypothetical protein